MTMISNLWDSATRAVRNHLHYRAVCDELGSLTDRELADLGISRGEIAFIARQSIQDLPQAAAPARRSDDRVISFGSSAVRPV